MWGFYSKNGKANYTIDPESELGLFRMFGGLAAMIDNPKYLPTQKLNVYIYNMEHYDITVKYNLQLVSKISEDFDEEALAIRTNDQNAYYLLKLANYSQIQFEAIMEGFDNVSKLIGLNSKPLLLYKGSSYEKRNYKDLKNYETLILQSQNGYVLKMPKFNDLFPMFYMGVIRCLNDYPPLVNKENEWYLRLSNLCQLVYGCKFTASRGSVPSDKPLREFCKGYISCYRLLIKSNAMSCNLITEDSTINIRVKSK